MTKFCGSCAQRLNSSLIRKIELLGGGVRITWANGDDEVFMKGRDKGTDDLIEEYCNTQYETADDDWQIIPAAPGWELIQVYGGDGREPGGVTEADIYREPVIAWRIDKECRCYADQTAITLTTNSSVYQDDDLWFGVVEPGGAVRAANKIEGSYKDVAEWLKAVLENWQERAKPAVAAE
jgi:hypothetical protein